MAFVLKDAVQETSTTTGTGTYTLGGAVTGYRTFGSVMANNDTTFYTAEDDLDWEVGIGTWATGGTLARTTILDSSNAAAAVNWSAGTRYVYMSRPAVKNQPGFRGALAYHNANQAITTATLTALALNSELYDTDTIHDTVTNNSRLTVPTGWIKVRLIGNVVWASDSGGTYRQIILHKNGATFNGTPQSLIPVGANALSHAQNIATSPLDVVATDYFELKVQHDKGSNLNVNTDNSTWFGMELLT